MIPFRANTTISFCPRSQRPAAKYIWSFSGDLDLARPSRGSGCVVGESIGRYRRLALLCSNPDTAKPVAAIKLAIIRGTADSGTRTKA